MKILAFGWLLLAVLIQPAQAGLLTYSTSFVGGFVANSASTNAGFMAAIGTPDEFLDFSADVGVADGSSFSDNVIFSSAYSSIYGGSDSANVQNNSSELGPVSGWNGILNIDFLAAGTTASIVGFGPVDFGTVESISVYNQNMSLIGSFGGVSNNAFDFFGLQATDTDQIGKIVMEGGFFAIQDLQFDFANVSQVPVPAAVFLFGPALLGFIGLRRKSKN